VGVSTIPNWNAVGVIPPIWPGYPGHSPVRSPYPASPLDVAQEFGASSERLKILDGWLRHRKEIHTAGIASGFQWLDGSFLENIEANENRSPKDIDVVTWFELPVGMAESDFHNAHPEMFDSTYTKPNYFVDAYGFPLGNRMGDMDIELVTYWYSMWAHRRDFTWKGFVRVEMNPAADQAAQSFIASYTP